jgi:hypothetical protein
VPAAAGAVAAAEKVRQLDIMLLVTSLRCRFEADDFRADYQAFSDHHRVALVAASRELRRALSARYGAQGANRALDRLSVHMANRYGLGHPTLNCGELKQATQTLAYNTGSDGLVAAADELLGGLPRESAFALAR